MKAERLFRVLGLINSDLIEEALSSQPVPRQTIRRRFTAAAACLALVCALGFVWRATDGFQNSFHYGSSGSSGGDSMGPGIMTPMDPGEGGGSGLDDGITFMSYAGPVFPLTTLEDPAGLTAERTVVWDLAPGAYADGEPRQWGAAVTDAYVLSNPTDADITVTALYPFAGSFDDLPEMHPTVTIENQTTEPALYAGVFSGGFQDTQGNRDPSDEEAWNLYNLDSWKSYQTLLESGAYQNQALAEHAALEIPVTVYEFSNFTAPHDQYQAATQAISFTVNEDETQILTYGINGMDWNHKTGFLRYSYFVPDGKRRESEPKMLIVLGEDIGGYTLEGYQDGGCEDGEEIEGVSCTVTRSETTLDAALERLCRSYQAQYSTDRARDQKNAFDFISFEMYRDAVTTFMAQYTSLSGMAMQRYTDGRLDDILAETLYHDRVFYLAFPVTVPAMGSTVVECQLWKAPSYDFHCSGSENVGLQGFDLVTRLGSTLNFRRQIAALKNTDGIELAGQNFGFDLENGITSVELNLNQAHYFLELRCREE